MANVILDTESIIKNNPQVTAESLQRAELLVERMKRLGIEKTGYRLMSPFSSSLKKTRKAERKEHDSV